MGPYEMCLMTVGDCMSGRIHLPVTFVNGEYFEKEYVYTYGSLMKEMNLDTQDVSRYQKILSQTLSKILFLVLIKSISGISFIFSRLT